jgi:hypothetical protein
MNEKKKEIKLGIFNILIDNNPIKNKIRNKL